MAVFCRAQRALLVTMSSTITWLSHFAAFLFELSLSHCRSPVTAVRMLKEFVELREGDVVVQNGANSAVGRAVIQSAHALGGPS